MAFFGGKLFALAALAGHLSFRPADDVDDLPYGKGYRRIQTEDDKGKHISLQRIRFGVMQGNRGTIRNVYDANGVKTGIKYI